MRWRLSIRIDANPDTPCRLSLVVSYNQHQAHDTWVWSRALRIAGVAYGLATALMAVFFGAGQVQAQLASPTGTVILTISGRIAQTNTDGAATFDLAMMMQLPAHTLVTNTIWTNGPQEFVGVRLADLLDIVGAEGSVLVAGAIDDYSARIPLEEDTLENALVAYERNGSAMPLRDKGPLWIIFPFDSSIRFQSRLIYSQSVQHLNRLVIE